MARLKNRRRPTRKGVVAAFVALCLVFILAMAAITLDGGGLLDKRRQAQATADASARAVARGAWTPAGFGALVLDYSGKAALNAQGNGAFTDTEGPIIVNSDNASAVVDGGNGMLKATTFFITGGATTSGGGQLITQP